MCRETRMSPHFAGLTERQRTASAPTCRRRPLLADRVRPSRAAGFTLIELLTVITIIAILATLLMTTLGSAKRKAREAVCTSNLHQIGIALQLYLDDFGERPTSLAMLVSAKYLGDGRVLSCPADRTGAAQPPSESVEVKTGSAAETGAASPLRVSYQHPLGWPDAQWNRLMQAHTRAGVVVCTFHDVRPPAQAGSRGAAQGLILRGQLDGTVVRRQTYAPEQTTLDSAVGASERSAPPASFSTDFSAALSLDVGPPWEFFSDDPPPENGL